MTKTLYELSSAFSLLDKLFLSYQKHIFDISVLKCIVANRPTCADIGVSAIGESVGISAWLIDKLGSIDYIR